MKTDNSKKWNEMTLKCEANFCTCDKCEVKYPWYDPHLKNKLAEILKNLTILVEHPP